jgi:hypothetical protein
MYTNFFPENRAFYVLKYGTAILATDNNTLWHKRSTCWIYKPTDTHSEYAILTALPRR